MEKIVEDRVVELTRNICHFLHNAATVEEIVNLIGPENVSKTFIEAVHDQMRKEADPLMMSYQADSEKYYYYKYSKNLMPLTNRYMMDGSNLSEDSSFYEFKVLDCFNNMSM
jgi:hypothetical protein